MEVDSCGRGGDEPRFTGPTRDGEAACPPHIGPLCLHSKTDALCACNCFMWIDPLQHPEFFPLCCGSARCISSPTLVMSVLAHHSCAAEEAGCCSSVCLRDLIFPRSSLFRCRWSLACCLTTPIACQATTRCSHRFRCICCVHGHFPRDRVKAPAAGRLCSGAWEPFRATFSSTTLSLCIQLHASRCRRFCPRALP